MKQWTLYHTRQLSWFRRTDQRLNLRSSQANQSVRLLIARPSVQAPYWVMSFLKCLPLIKVLDGSLWELIDLL